MTRPAAVLLLLALLIGPVRADASPGREISAGRQLLPGPQRPATYRAPVTPLTVLRGFTPPATRYGAGHLGVDLAAGGAVHAAGAGTVSFAGSVAGRGVVVVLHPDGIRTEYEPVRPVVVPGAQVSAGQVLGTVSGTHLGCPVTCLHWGARRGTTYLDPLSLLHPLGPVRLLPWSG